jgi:flagella basal body P-ring formation protein FlgA
MKKIIIFFTLIVLVLNLNSLTLRFKNVALINSEDIRLRDLVESYQGENDDYELIQNLVVENLTYNRRMLNVKSNDIMEKIRFHYPVLSVRAVSSVIAVRWEEMTLDSGRIQKEASDFLRRHYTLSSEAEINITNIPRVPIPNQNVSIRFEKSNFSENSNIIRLDGNVFHQNDVISAFHILARITDTQYVFQSNRSIRKGESISSSDFIRVRLAVSPNNPFLTIFDDSAELIASRFIAKGANIRNTDVETAPFVRRNELVNVIVRSSTMQLNYQATSRANGWLGDRIMLENPDSRQTFHARVIDRNTVLIEL